MRIVSALEKAVSLRAVICSMRMSSPLASLTTERTTYSDGGFGFFVGFPSVELPVLDFGLNGFFVEPLEMM